MPAVKEPSYFLAHVVDYGVPDAASYYRLFAEAGTRLAGEASAGYLAEPEAAARIFAELGDVAVIILLRDPVARAYSLWRWMVGEGVEPIRTFEEALAAEPDRAADPALVARYRQSVWDYLYVRSGFYAAQVEAYKQRFSRVLVLRSDDLSGRPQEAFAEVCAFLGVPAVPVEPQRLNVSRPPRSVTVQLWARGRHRWLDDHQPPGHAVLERGLWKLMALNQRVGPGGRLHPVTEGRLRRTFAADITRTAEVTGLDLDAWVGQAPAAR